jgi:hypothetical protein
MCHIVTLVFTPTPLLSDILMFQKNVQITFGRNAKIGIKNFFNVTLHFGKTPSSPLCHLVTQSRNPQPPPPSTLAPSPIHECDVFFEWPRRSN